MGHETLEMDDAVAWRGVVLVATRRRRGQRAGDDRLPPHLSPREVDPLLRSFPTDAVADAISGISTWRSTPHRDRCARVRTIAGNLRRSGATTRIVGWGCNQARL